MNELALLPPRNFAIFESQFLFEYNKEPRTSPITNFCKFFKVCKIHVQRDAFFPQSRMLIRKNVNSDVRKDPFHDHLAIGHY